jgi:hypothetical protein
LKNLNTILKGVIAVIVGVIAGSALNMGLIMISGSIIAPPEGALTTTTEGLKESLHLFKPKHFLLPFMAHGLGTLFGALIAALIVSKHKIRFALGIGCWFLLGGITMTFMLPSPIWFTIVDLSLAYIPMAYLGGLLAVKLTSKTRVT